MRFDQLIWGLFTKERQGKSLIVLDFHKRKGQKAKKPTKIADM